MLRGLLLACLACACFAQVAPQYADFGIGGTACCVVPDGKGGNWTAGTYRRSTLIDPVSAVRVVHLDSSGATTGAWTFGGSAFGNTDEAYGTALDPTGNLVVVGTTDSGNFPASQKLGSVSPGTAAGFVLRLGADGATLSSALIGAAARANSVAVGPDGSIYVAGLTATGGEHGYLAKLTKAADAIAWTTQLGGSTPNAISKSRNLPAYTEAVAVAVDAAGAVTVAGNTNTSDFPVMAAYQSICDCEKNGGASGFVMRLDSGGQMVWSTYAGPGAIASMALDSAGGVVVAGSVQSGLASGSFPSTPGAYQGSSHRPDGFVMKFDPLGATLLFATLLGGSGNDEVTTVAVDAAGEVLVGGVTDSADFPVSVPTQGANFVAVLSRDGTALVQSVRVPDGAGDAQAQATPALMMLGSSGSLLSIPTPFPAGPTLLGVDNSAGDRVSAQVSPGEFVSLYGTFTGVGTPVTVAPGKLGFPNQAAGVQVLFDNIAAPLLYVSATQINAVVPFEVAGRTSTTLKIWTPGGWIPSVVMPVVATTPVIFAVTHANGAPVMPGNGAQAGEVLTLWAGGAGVFHPALATGALVTNAPLAAPVLPVQVLYNDTPLDLIYTGTAPGLIAGGLQVNFRVDLLGSVQLKVGDTVSEPVQIDW